MDETPRWPLPLAAVGVLLMTFAGLDAFWQLFVNTDPTVPAGAAWTGVWLTTRLVLGGLGGALILVAAGMLYATREAPA
jgi:hypothetical protein